MNYLVKKAFERFAAGATIALNARQAKYLLMSGHIEAIVDTKAAPADEVKK